MSEYKLVGVVNRHTEGSNRVLLSGERELVLGGAAVDLTDAEVKHLEDRFVLEKVVEDKPLATDKPATHKAWPTTVTEEVK